LLHPASSRVDHSRRYISRFQEGTLARVPEPGSLSRLREVDFGVDDQIAEENSALAGAGADGALVRLSPVDDPVIGGLVDIELKLAGVVIGSPRWAWLWNGGDSVTVDGTALTLGVAEPTRGASVLSTTL
jgi:hypothetical protein